MKLYPQDTLSKFQFGFIKDKLRTNCHGNLAKNKVDELVPVSDKDLIQLWLNQTEELYSIYLRSIYFPPIQYPSIEREISRLKIAGSVLEEPEFVKLVQLLNFTQSIIEFIRARKIAQPYLNKVIEHLELNKELVKSILQIVDENGTVKSTASKKLFEIRENYQFTRQKGARLYDAAIRKYKAKGWLADFTEGIANDRRVLAVLAENKRKIAGIIHGSSDTGKTTFIEPAELVEVNNRLKDLETDERREVYRILQILTAETALELPYIEACTEVVSQIDFISAKAYLAVEMEAMKPRISTDTTLVLDKAVHPILLYQNKKDGKKVVPLDLVLDNQNRIIIISGPNAGGKSIALKTLGLLQIMFQSGLMVSAGTNTAFSIKEQLFVDIGDDQSIEEELSTFSSRLIKMKYFLEFLNRKSLFLIDEFGTGTDPELGGAMAETILEKINEFGCQGVVTTHYSNIKVMAETTESIQNACMLFERNSLKPLYKLVVGQPGSSFTFEVARKIGLPKEIISGSKQKVKSHKVQMDKLIVSLQNEKQLLSTSREKIEGEKSEAFRLQKVFDLLLKDLKIRQKNEQNKLEETNRLSLLGAKMDKWLQSWKDSHQRKDVIKRITASFDSELAKHIEKEAALKLEKARKFERKNKKAEIKKKRFEPRLVIGVGDQVELEGTNQRGSVESIKDKKAMVLFDTLKMSIDLLKLRKIVQNNKKNQQSEN